MKKISLIACIIMVLIMAVGCSKDVAAPTEEEIIDGLKKKHQLVDSVKVKENKLNKDKDIATVSGEFVENQECADVTCPFTMKFKYEDKAWKVSNLVVEEWDVVVHTPPTQERIKGNACEYAELKLDDGRIIEMNDTEITMGETKWENTKTTTDITAVYVEDDYTYTFKIELIMRYYDEYGEWAHFNNKVSYTREATKK